MTLNTLISVDIQPEYIDYIDLHFNMSDYVKYMNSFDSVLFMFNDEELTSDTQYDITNWLHSYGANINAITFMPKQYGYLRSQMDNGTDSDDIVNCLHKMKAHDTHDSRDINVFDDDQKFIKFFLVI